MNMQDFIKKVQQDETLKEEVNTAGSLISTVDSEELRRDLANKLAEIASRHGYDISPEEFFQQDDDSWMRG